MEVSVLDSNLLNADTKGTVPSVHITEVSVLQSNHLNKETKWTVPSDCITEVSVLQLNLLVQTPLRQSQVSTSQRCLYYS